MKLLRFSLILALCVTATAARAFEKPDKIKHEQALSRAGVGTTLRSHYTAVYRVPIEFDGPRSTFNTLAVTKAQYKNWKKSMKGIQKRLKAGKLSLEGAQGEATTWVPAVR